VQIQDIHTRFQTPPERKFVGGERRRFLENWADGSPDILLLLLLLLFTAIWLAPGGSGCLHVHKHELGY
jgi:hypothetical protein